MKWEEGEIFPAHWIKYAGHDYFSLDELKKMNIEIIRFDFSTIGVDNDIPEVLKSDILRYYMLYIYWGVWSDLDILYINSMENIIFNIDSMINGDFRLIDTVVSNYTNRGINYYYIGFLMSSQNN